MSNSEATRKVTLDTVTKVADKGVEVFGCEPIGFVLLYPDAAFLKIVWKDVVGSREDTSRALMEASADEMSKMEGLFHNE